MTEDTRALVESHKQITKRALIEYTPLVKDIISNKVTNQNQIERTLDGILDFCFDADMLLLFKELCRYYLYINPAATEFYINSYRELWDSDSITP